MKKKIIILLLTLSFIIPNSANALSINEETQVDTNIVSQTVKYYKTVSRNNNILLSTSTDNNIDSYTVEISKEEYETANSSIQFNSAYVETTYKKLTSTILQNGSKYRYKAELNWKKFPSTRSYDIIGIGFYPSVKLSSTIYFNQYYCISGGNCYTLSKYTPQTFSSGIGASFKVPEGNLTTLKQTLYFDVEKSSSATIIKQIAAADYSHATKTVSETNAKKYTVDTLSIDLDSSISGSYDAISTATATWNGSW